MAQLTHGVVRDMGLSTPMLLLLLIVNLILSNHLKVCAALIVLIVFIWVKWELSLSCHGLDSAILDFWVCISAITVIVVVYHGILLESGRFLRKNEKCQIKPKIILFIN